MPQTIATLLLCSALLVAVPAQAFLINDPQASEQWYLSTVRAPDAWDITTGSPQVVVAVLDTGVDIDHPDLAANIWKNNGEIPGDGIDNDGNGFIDDASGWNFVEGDNDSRPTLTGISTREAVSHGTLVAGIIAATINNHEGIAGIAPQVKIMPVRVLDSRGTGNVDTVIKGIDYAIQNGASVINLSFTTDLVPPEFTAAVKRAVDAGIVVVAAAGNDAGGIDTDTHPIYPACTNGPVGENWVLGVAATTPADERSSFSNYGSLCVDLSAPGEGIFSTQFVDPRLPDSRSYGGGWAGTSLAAPMVSATAALVRSVAPRLRRADVVDILLRSADPIDDTNPSFRGRLGRGRVNVLRAVTMARALVSRLLLPTIVVSGDTGSPRLWLFNDAGTLITSFLAYAPTFRGGVRLASGDVDGRGLHDIVTVPGPGSVPRVRVFDEVGNLRHEFLAFDARDREGFSVASGDVNGDGRDDIVVGAGPGAAPRVRVFDSVGQMRADFLAFDEHFTGGVEVAVGNTDGVGPNEIVVAVHGAGGPQVRVFDGRGNLVGQFFAFEEKYRGGVRIAVADVGGPVGAEILATRGGTETTFVQEMRSRGGAWNTFIAFANRQLGPMAVASRRGTAAISEIFIAAAQKGHLPSLHEFTPLGVLINAFSLPAELGSSLHIATL